jgi:HEAT repeat protein
MTQPRAGRFRQIRRRYAVGTLVCICVLGLVPSARGNTDQVDNYIRQLKDKHADIRARAAAALGEMKDPRAVEPLIATLADPDSSVRSYVALALGKIKDARAV